MCMKMYHENVLFYFEELYSLLCEMLCVYYVLINSDLDVFLKICFFYRKKSALFVSKNFYLPILGCFPMGV